MSLKDKLPALFVTIFVIGGVGVIASKISGPANDGSIVQVKVPTLTASAQRGQSLFAENCAACHGEAGSGTEQGPPLIHKTYNPGHHGDNAFVSAVKNGVTAHHWPYGNMPPQPQVGASDIKSITRFVREVQVANGVVYQPHQM